MINKQTLYKRLDSHLRELGLPVDEVDLLIRPYSSTYYGNYYPSLDPEVKPRIFIYPYSNKKGTALYPYSQILSTTIHEWIHHLQYRDPNFVRIKGVMHNPEFWRLYHQYMKQAYEKNLIAKEDYLDSETSYQKVLV